MWCKLVNVKGNTERTCHCGWIHSTLCEWNSVRGAGFFILPIPAEAHGKRIQMRALQQEGDRPEPDSFASAEMLAHHTRIIFQQYHLIIMFSPGAYDVKGSVCLQMRVLYMYHGNSDFFSLETVYTNGCIALKPTRNNFSSFQVQIFLWRVISYQ